jgi:hypothetical protein
MWQPRPTVASVILLLLGTAAVRAQEVSKAAEPEIGFLEFLGSVDRLSDLMPDYLSQAELGAKASTGSTPAPPPPQRPPQTPSAPPNGSGGHNNG